MAVRAKLVRIGHSRGIRIPRALIEMAELTEDLELYASPGELIVRVPGFHPRRGWAADAAAMHAAGEDRLEPLNPWPTTRSQPQARPRGRKKTER